jgi:curved DNA-binding protein
MEKEASKDYYEILQVSPKADQEVIERIYRLLAKRYHPDNKHTGDASKFGSLMEAYHVLSDPEKRAGYEDHYKAANAYQSSIFSNASQPRGPEAERRVHEAILSILYVARREDVMKPGVGIVLLEKLLGLSGKALEFHVWYLKEKGWIQRVETGEFAITASGVDVVVEKNLILRKDRLLPSATESSLTGVVPKDLRSSEKPIPGDPSDQLSN